MNMYFRLSTAILISLLAHMVLLIFVMQQVREQPPQFLRQLQVYLPQRSIVQDGQSYLHSVESAINETKARDIQEPSDTDKLAQGNSMGRFSSEHFLWQHTPTYQQNELMDTMRLAQLARQRESKLVAVRMELSNLSVKLRPVVTANIVCIQQSDNEIDCMPEPDRKIRPLLEQFFRLAMESRQLSSEMNPVSMDLGTKLSVSIKFLH